jgi:hypothetical protein
VSVWDYFHTSLREDPIAFMVISINDKIRTITGDISSIGRPLNIALLCIAMFMVPTFVFWMKYQETNGQPALIPNSLWKKSAFASICVMVLLVWAVLNSMEVIFSL